MNKLCTTLLLISLTGCNTVTPHYDARFGEAVRQAKAAQVINPQAGKDGDTVAGVSGNASVRAMTEYQKTFSAPPPAPVNIISVGNVSGGAR